jgi:colanic acid/amylovoran biosynthesis protein
VLPRGVVRGLRDTVQGDLSGGLRSIAITAGFASATTGFAVRRVASAADRAAGMIRRGSARPAQAWPGQPPGAGSRAPRILIDQSGYDLLNVGDVAMLESCVLRLQRLWPGAEIMVVCHAPGRLAACCPGTVAIGRTFADRRLAQILPRRYRLAAEQAWKIAAPYLAGRLSRSRTRPDRPRTAIQAVLAADLVVASGGGYLTDTWWWHAAGVLSLLSLAQRRGKPTAMFGQGVGPIDQPALRAQARAVLPALIRLGLREDVTGRDLALSLGARPGVLAVTGDDALELIPGASIPAGHALGVSMRVSAYAGVDLAAARTAGDVVVQAAKAFQAPVVALPVSRYPVDGDLAALCALLGPEGSGTGVALDDLATSEALITAAACCRVIVTGSYHAAVFGLAQGVPAVCLTRSRYYDAKFAGLRALFPGACSVVSLDEPGFAGRLRAAIDRAWHLPAAVRAAARDAAAGQRAAGRDAYARFGETAWPQTANRREEVR